MFKLPFFKNSPEKNTKFLTLDINYDCVRCLSFYKENGTIKIIGSGIEVVPVGAVRNGIIVDTENVTAAVQSAVSKATQNVEEPISNVIIGATSDVCQETVTTAKITRGSDELINKKEINDFEQKILDSAYLQVQNKYSETTGNMDEDFQLTTSSIVYVKVNNQKVDSLLEKQGHTIEMAMYTAYCPTHYVKSLQKLAKNIGLTIFAISSENFAMLKALKASELESTDFALIQAGSDFTNVGIVFGGSIVANKSLHIGRRHFVDEIGRKMGITVEEAKKVFDTHIKNGLTASESAMVQDCLRDILDLWLEGVKLLFSDFSGIKKFSPYVYLFGAGTELPEIEESLTNNAWAKAMPFHPAPEIKLLSINDIPRISDATGIVTSENWLTTIVLAFVYEELL